MSARADVRGGLLAAAAVLVACSPLVALRGGFHPYVGPQDAYTGGHHLLDFMTTWVLFVALTAAACRVLPRLRLPLLATSTLGFMALTLSPPVIAILLVGSLILRSLLGTLAGRARLLAYIAWAVLFCVLLPCEYLHFAKVGDRWVLSSRQFRESLAGGFLMASFFKRSIWLWWESRREDARTWPLADVLLYLVGLPNLLGLAAAPSFSHFTRARSDDGAVLWRGVGTAVVCLFWIMVVALIGDSGFPYRVMAAVEPHRKTMTLAAVWLAIVFVRWWSYLHRLFNDQFSVGAWRLLGYDLRDDFRGPLWARSPVDNWRRWNVLWREFLLTAMFYPTVLALARRHGPRTPWIYFAATLLTFAGATFFDLMPWILYVAWVLPAGAADLALAFGLYHLAQGLLVGGELYLQARRFGRVQVEGAASRPVGMGGALRWAGSVAITFLVMALLHLWHHLLPLSEKWRLTLAALGF